MTLAQTGDSIAPTRGRIAFLFLGETLLIPHLYPIVEALAHKDLGVSIDLWVSTSIHERLLERWTKGMGNIRIRRAPAYRDVDVIEDGRNPGLPSKLPMLLRLAPRLRGTSVVVCAEQTSLWIPRLLPWSRTRFVKTSHGVGSMSARDDKRRKAAFHTLVPSEQERETYLARGMRPDRIVATGYVKSAFRQRKPKGDLFATPRPVVLFTPHWQPHRSSWPRWGAAVARMLARQREFNVILAPHQRLVEQAPDLLKVFEDLGGLEHVHADTDSFAMVDGSYTAAADIYLGDTSSQLIEFLTEPRPAVFLNPIVRDWKSDPAFAMWRSGEVVTDVEEMMPALRRAHALHPGYKEVQQAIAKSALGITGEIAAINAADEVVRVYRGG